MTNVRRFAVAGLIAGFLAGCSGTGLRKVEEGYRSFAAPAARAEAPQPLPPWQQGPETAAAAGFPLFSPAPFPGGTSQQVRWRCEVSWRCYDTDDDTGDRTELLDSGTAWYEGAGSRDWVCGRAKAQLSGGSPCNTGHPDYYELEKDDECVCSRPGQEAQERHSRIDDGP